MRPSVTVILASDQEDPASFASVRDGALIAVMARPPMFFSLGQMAPQFLLPVETSHFPSTA